MAYDGTRYHGWQRQSRLPSIQGAIEAALEQLTQKSASLYGAGRTDAGVHALAQVAHFDTEHGFKEDEWRRALNALLPPDIVIQQAEVVDGDFHARYSAGSKVYRYQIRNAPLPSPFDIKWTWHIRQPLDFEKMTLAAKGFLGVQDFRSFCAAGAEVKNHLLEMKRVHIEKKGERLWITLEASRFLQHMVRNIVGFLVEAGQARRAPEDTFRVLSAGDRRAAGITAPPQGLFLLKVNY